MASITLFGDVLQSRALAIAADTLLAALGLLLFRKLLLRLLQPIPSASSHLPLPPGPSPKPLLGNLLDVPTGRSWLGWATHAARFGPLSHLNIFGTHLIVLHDPAAAAHLFEKRSAVFSDRPRIVFGGEMCGWENTLALQRYGDRFRLFRKEIHQVLGTPAAIAKFHPMIETECRRFLLKVLNDPARLLKHIQTATGASIVRIAYGYTIEPSGRDPLLQITHEGIAQISMAAQPGAFIVDVLPFLRHLPTWFPGARSFHKTAKHFRETVTELVEKPFAFVKAKMASGDAQPCYVSALLEKYDKEGQGITPEQEFVIKWSASSLYTGGADTTVSAIQSFFLAMVLHPRVLQKAREEVDAVTGGQRLPTFQDRMNLPYINAIVQEVLRWAPIAPMGLPHVNMEEVEYNGYRIPKGSIVMPNIWQYSHDPDVYDSPFDFKPERFMPIASSTTGTAGKMNSFARQPPSSTTKVNRDVREYVFGFGRRACPGRELADASLFCFVAMTVATLEIGKMDGKEVRKEWVPGTITHPEPFALDARARNATVEQLVRSVELEHPQDTSDAEQLVHLDWRKSGASLAAPLHTDA